MCTRFVSKADQDREREWSLVRPPFQLDKIDVRVTDQIPVIYESDEGLVCEPMRWGMIPPGFTGDKWKWDTWNARIETIAELPSFRRAWSNGQFGVIPAWGLYEYQEVGKPRKQRWVIRPRHDREFSVGALWEYNEKWGYSATFIMLPAAENELWRTIHNSGNKHRIPLLLPSVNRMYWLGNRDPQAALELVYEMPEDSMEAWPVSSRVTPDDLVKP